MNYKLRENVELLNPVSEMTNYCQKSTTSAADAVEKWSKLLVNGPEDLREFVDSRFVENNVFIILSMTANYFHPIYRGKVLNEQQQQEVKDYLFHQLEAEGLELLRQFTAGEGTFANLLCGETFESSSINSATRTTIFKLVLYT